MTVRFTERRVDENGDVVETVKEEMFEIDHHGPDLNVTETVVETSWDGPDTPARSLDTNPATGGVGGAGPPGAPFGGFNIPTRRGGITGTRSPGPDIPTRRGSTGGGRAAGPSSVNVSVDVSGVTGEPVQQAVQRAVEQNRQQIAADVQNEVERKLSRESGGFAVSGPSGRF